MLFQLGGEAQKTVGRDTLGLCTRLLGAPVTSQLVLNTLAGFLAVASQPVQVQVLSLALFV
jgi:hypothetical protein